MRIIRLTESLPSNVPQIVAPPDHEPAAYDAYVQADGGAVADPTALAADVDRMVADGYWWAVEYALSGRWGTRYTGVDTEPATIYSLGPAYSAGRRLAEETSNFDAAGALDPDGHLFTFGLYGFDRQVVLNMDLLVTIRYRARVPNLTGRHVLSIVQSYGLATEVARFYHANIDGTDRIVGRASGSGDIPAAANAQDGWQVATLAFDHKGATATMRVNGVLQGSASYVPGRTGRLLLGGFPSPTGGHSSLALDPGIVTSDVLVLRAPGVAGAARVVEARLMSL